jgi:flagellar basal body-associated protein FliL
VFKRSYWFKEIDSEDKSKRELTGKAQAILKPILVSLILGVVVGLYLFLVYYTKGLEKEEAEAKETFPIHGVVEYVKEAVTLNENGLDTASKTIFISVNGVEYKISPDMEDLVRTKAVVDLAVYKKSEIREVRSLSVIK